MDPVQNCCGRQSHFRPIDFADTEWQPHDALNWSNRFEIHIIPPACGPVRFHRVETVDENHPAFHPRRLHGRARPDRRRPRVLRRAYCQREFSIAGLYPNFVQVNNSVSRTPGTLRGLHYQLGRHAEDKLLRCVNGAFFDVVLDLRPQSATYLQHCTLEITHPAQRGLRTARMRQWRRNA